MAEPVQMLWIGPRLSAMERLSMRSFLANGHPVRLFTYDDVGGIPEGVERVDGRGVLPEDSVFAYPCSRTQSWKIPLTFGLVDRRRIGGSTAHLATLTANYPTSAAVTLTQGA